MIISPKCIVELRTKYKTLPPKVRQVADFIIQNPEKAIGSNIQSLAEQIGVSQFTILNCVRAVGYRGYTDFRLDLAMNVQRVESSLGNAAPGDLDDRKENATYRCFVNTCESNARCLLDTIQIIKPEVFVYAVDWIFAAKRTAIYGLDFSSYAAQYLRMQLVRLGLHAVAVIEASYQLLDSLTLIENDLLIGFSPSGSASSILESFRQAKRSRCRTIAVTAVSDSDLAREADATLLTTSSGPQHSADTDNSIVEQISLASSLATAVYEGMCQGRHRTI